MTEWNVPTMIGRMNWARKDHKSHLFVKDSDYTWARVCDWTAWWPEMVIEQTDLTCKVCANVKPRELK